MFRRLSGQSARPIQRSSPQGERALERRERRTRHGGWFCGFYRHEIPKLYHTSTIFLSYAFLSIEISSKSGQLFTIAIACCHLATCHLLATRPCESHQVIHAEIRSAVEVIRQEDQDWLVSGWVPTGHYWTFAKREKIAYSNGLISVISCLKIA